MRMSNKGVSTSNRSQMKCWLIFSITQRLSWTLLSVRAHVRTIRYKCAPFGERIFSWKMTTTFLSSPCFLCSDANQVKWKGWGESSKTTGLQQSRLTNMCVYLQSLMRGDDERVIPFNLIYHMFCHLRVSFERCKLCVIWNGMRAIATSWTANRSEPAAIASPVSCTPTVCCWLSPRLDSSAMTILVQ